VPIDRQEVVHFLSSKMCATLTERGTPTTFLPESFNFMDADLFDSLGFVRLILEIEQRFNIRFDLSDADPEVLVTIGGLAETAAQSSPAS